LKGEGKSSSLVFETFNLEGFRYGERQVTYLQGLVGNEEQLKPGKSVVKTKIIGKQKISHLVEFIKIFYLTSQQQKTTFC
jgi:hypothetical protein